MVRGFLPHRCPAHSWLGWVFVVSVLQAAHDAKPSGSVPVLSGLFGVGGVDWCVVCLYLENCTVDASIFVVKFLRAHGGCLGTRSR